jgi:hypothetical protein
MVSTGAAFDHSRNWHREFCAHLDAFLSAMRSVPEIIRCSFGKDSHWKIRYWFDSLDQGEQERRREFDARFKPNYDTFAALPLGTARHISEHRTGFAPVTVTISGRFGVTYTGDPINRLPITETRPVDEGFGWL